MRVGVRREKRKKSKEIRVVVMLANSLQSE